MQVLVNFVNCKRVTLGRNNGNISGAELMVWVGRRPLHKRMAQKSPVVHVLLPGNASTAERFTGRNSGFNGKERDEAAAAEW